jgi:hypothetical protein
MNALTLDQREAKAATHRLVRACGGGEGAAATVAAALGHACRQQRMSACGSQASPDFLRIDEVVALEAVAGPIVTRMLAARAGFVLMPLAADTCPGSMAERVAAAARESGEAIAAALDTSSVASRAVAAQEIAEAIETLTRLHAAVIDG